MTTAFSAGVCYVDFAPIADPDLVAVTVARALGLPDQPGRSAVASLLGFVSDACAPLVDTLLGDCSNVKTLATSREPLGVAGEVTWRVPSLSVNDEAVELFVDRGGLVRPSFTLTDTNRATVLEICSRLDGMPLAIELAAARIRALSPTEILDGLHDRFRLLTGGARTTVPRQQTLWASVDWSHALLTDAERILFRRLAVFAGGFDLEAAQAVAAGDELERGEILDLLTLLVDKSLVLAEYAETRTRYRLLETMRQYAFEKLGGSAEADAIRIRHRNFYAQVASVVDGAVESGREQSLAQAVREIDNFRAAFTWSRENSETEVALALASSLQPLWHSSGRVHEGIAWFDAVLTDSCPTDVAPTVWTRALADSAVLHSWAVGLVTTQQAEVALANARELGDPALLARALAARGIVAANRGTPAQQYFAEAADLARAVGDRWRLSQILAWQVNLAFLAGDPIAARAAASEGRELADAVGDRFASRQCRTWAGWAQTITGDLANAAIQLAAVKDEARTEHDLIWWVVSTHYWAQAMVYQEDSRVVAAALAEVMPALADFGPVWSGNSNGVHAAAALAAGDVDEAERASNVACELLVPIPVHRKMYVFIQAQAALARGDVTRARARADESVASATGWYRVQSLTVRARVLIAEQEPEQAERDAYSALTLATGLDANLGVPDILECLAMTAGACGSQRRSARLFGAADAIRQRMGAARFKVHDANHQAALQATRNVLGDNDFDAAFAEGAALSTAEAITYAQRGKGERRRPATGWASLTPAERDIVRLVCDGLANKEIAKRLLVSPRTVQTHLTHIYTKLNLTSRVQLVQEASRHDD
jgi:predicted ATPase/DNA-binding CsgD family transcriptional regulator